MQGMEEKGNKIMLTKKVVISQSAQETELIGQRIGAQLRGGEMIVLSSDLGGGKTTFVRGLAAGVGSNDHVASPTFTVGKVYTAAKDAKKLEIHHFDFYRLDEPGIIRNELVELIGDPAVVLVLEWSDVVESSLPEEKLLIRMERVARDESSRQLVLQYPTSLAYLVEELS